MRAVMMVIAVLAIFSCAGCEKDVKEVNSGGIGPGSITVDA
jgi:hypothetical protein